MKIHWKRLLPLFFILALILFIYLSGIYRLLNLETIRKNHLIIQNYVQNHPILSPFIFMGIFVIIILCALPVGPVVNLVGGVIFPQPYSTFYAALGAVTGGALMFLAIRHANFHFFFQAKLARYLPRIEREISRHGWNYLITIRILPIIPFSLVNIAAALVGIRFWTFLWTAFLGVLPTSYAFTAAGQGLSSLLTSDEPFSMAEIFNYHILIAVGLIFLFTLLPLFFTRKR